MQLGQLGPRGQAFGCPQQACRRAVLLRGAPGGLRHAVRSHAAAPEVPSESQPPATEQQSQPRKPAGRRALFGGGAAAEGEGAAGATHPPAPAAAESQDAQSSGTAPAAAPATTAKALVNIHKQTLKEAGIEVVRRMLLTATLCEWGPGECGGVLGAERSVDGNGPTPQPPAHVGTRHACHRPAEE